MHRLEPLILVTPKTAKQQVSPRVRRRISPPPAFGPTPRRTPAGCKPQNRHSRTPPTGAERRSDGRPVSGAERR